MSYSEDQQWPEMSDSGNQQRSEMSGSEDQQLLAAFKSLNIPPTSIKSGEDLVEFIKHYGSKWKEEAEQCEETHEDDIGFTAKGKAHKGAKPKLVVGSSLPFAKISCFFWREVKRRSVFPFLEI